MTQQINGMPDLNYSKENFLKLYEALKALLTLHDEDCRMLDRGIGTDTPQGQKVSRAREALAEVEGK